MVGKAWMAMVLVAVTTAMVACGRTEAPDSASEERALRWEPVPDAATHRVRGWAGDQLLFEVFTGADSLVWTPSLVRSISAFDTVDVRIQGLGPRDEAVGPVQEIRVRPRRGPSAR